MRATSMLQKNPRRSGGCVRTRYKPDDAIVRGYSVLNFAKLRLAVIGKTP
jgi:hypothetical protein